MLTDFLVALPWMDAAKAKIAIEAAGPLFKGLWQFTLPLTLISFIIGLIFAFLLALPRIGRPKHIWHLIAYRLATIYISIIRGTPMLAQLFIIFYALPNIGITLDPFPTAIIAFSLNTTAYGSEIIRAAILSIPKGQWEAGYTIGMDNRQTLMRIILPQALRVAIPPLSNNFIGLVKETSLASVVLVPEMMRQANIIASRTYEFLLVYTEAALFYWVICFLLNLIQMRLEKYFDRYIAK
ncbi:L-cystine transport system permease protein tcyB [Suttonella ornithocola]|uniref:L-cystine transport system permease protein tcyB n=2 Tax=Suttonella ornithocola TaxID=279832 RepID=A0A380MVV7_9GAMM|nr:amino acid ABC transporter permease [Suttonella ornithocola]SUO95841.1 L-cystine transport system permease protein tcyB [Suttonella ornithocola]